MSDTGLGTLCTLWHLTLKIALWGQYYFYPIKNGGSEGLRTLLKAALMAGGWSSDVMPGPLARARASDIGLRSPGVFTISVTNLGKWPWPVEWEGTWLQRFCTGPSTGDSVLKPSTFPNTILSPENSPENQLWDAKVLWLPLEGWSKKVS